MKLITAKEAYEQKFNTTLGGGYDRDEVDDFLDERVVPTLVFLQDFYRSHGGLDGIAYD